MAAKIITIVLLLCYSLTCITVTPAPTKKQEAPAGGAGAAGGETFTAALTGWGHFSGAE